MQDDAIGIRLTGVMQFGDSPTEKALAEVAYNLRRLIQEQQANSLIGMEDLERVFGPDAKAAILSPKSMYTKGKNLLAQADETLKTILTV